MLQLPLAIFATDRLIKFHVDKMMELDEKKELCGGRIILRKYYNEGAACGVLSALPKVLTAIQGILLAITAVCYVLLLKKEGKRGVKLAAGMVLGGGFSNFYDRLRHKHVIDYISFPVPWKWLRCMVFNLADFFIFAGAALTVLFSKD